MMQTFGRIGTGIAAVALVGMIGLGCAAKQPEPPRDTWTAAAQRADAAASRAETAASRAEAAAGRVETAAQRAEDAAARVEAMVSKSMRK
jgi:3-hydroxyacyl-CoA dehydrogenase